MCRQIIKGYLIKRTNTSKLNLMKKLYGLAILMKKFKQESKIKPKPRKLMKKFLHSINKVF